LKNKVLIISTLFFFLIINTNYFWEGKLGIVAFPVFLILVLVFIVLSILLLNQFVKGIKEKFSDKSRIVTIGIVSIILILTFIKPNGLINFDKFNGTDILIAQREGAANCMTTIKLKENMTFRERSVCFGVTEIKGTYELRNDTVFFENIEYGRNENEFYEFAVIEPSKINPDKFDFVRFKNKNDTIGHELWVVKNELNELKTK
jgi:hypothetical protein